MRQCLESAVVKVRVYTGAKLVIQAGACSQGGVDKYQHSNLENLAESLPSNLDEFIKTKGRPINH